MDYFQPCAHGLRAPSRTQFDGLAALFPRRLSMRRRALCFLFLGCSIAGADDWPQWMGPKGDGVYRETGIFKELPKEGLKYRWRKPIGMGYSGPSVANGKVYVMDRKPDPKPGQKKEAPKKDPNNPNKIIFPKDSTIERTICLRADNGEQVWERVNGVDYQISYGEGPRATPTVVEGKVYALGAMGLLECLNADDGKLIWSHDFQKEYKAPQQAWGWAAHPVIDGDRVITLVGGKGSAVVAFDKNTGKELWKALDSEEVGYTPALVATFGGKPQVIIYMSDGVYGLEPASGKKLWGLAYPIEGKPSRPAVPITRPLVVAENKIYITSGYEGELLIDLGPSGTAPKVIYHGTNIQKQEDKPTGLHGLITTPILAGGNVVGVDFNGELRGLDPMTGERKWESMDFWGGKPAMFGTAFLTPHEDRCFVFTDQGDLWLGKFTAKGFENTSKAKLIEAVQPARGRRKVVWTHPAYADKAVFVRNQQEIVCAELAAKS
jgi:outer membrane protein assembly factor BamB